MRNDNHHAMPTWPPVAGRRTITVDMLPQQVKHLDTQADFIGCSRAAYLRRLVIEDRSAHPTRTIHPDAATDLADASTCAFELREELIAHCDAQATRLGCSRSAYIRHLVLSDIRRQGPAVTA